MARHPPRRKPSQQRAKASVDAIVEACAQVLVRDGWEAVTTQTLADRAGVSVGTLYQYFADRDAVLAALRERIMAEQLAAVASVMSEVRETRPGFEAALDRLMDTVFAVVSVRPELMRRLLLESPPDALEAIDAVWKERANQLVRGVLYAGAARIRPGNVDVMATLLVSAVFGAVRDVVAHRPDLLLTPDFRSELTELVRRYLGPDAPPP
ncbi:MAG: TetR/AcrR family transcriptional regulator [Planctomycetota bacterium]